jgi:hypothetical protein
MSEDLKHIYSGTLVEAGFVAQILEENGISVISRNPLRESVIAGWASGGLSDETLRLFVAAEDEEKALKLVDEYLKSR